MAFWMKKRQKLSLQSVEIEKEREASDSSSRGGKLERKASITTICAHSSSGQLARNIALLFFTSTAVIHFFIWLSIILND